MNIVNGDFNNFHEDSDSRDMKLFVPESPYCTRISFANWKLETGERQHVYISMYVAMTSWYQK